MTTETKQLAYIDFDTALFMNPDNARAMLDEVMSSDESSFENVAAERANASAHFWYEYTKSNLKKAVDIFDRMDKSPKMYDIYYIIKANGTKGVHCMSTLAGNVNDAKTIVDYMVLRQTGHTAFTKTNGKLPNGWNWEYIAERDGITVDEIMTKAKSDGYTFA